MTLRVHLFGGLLIERGGERLDLRALTPKARAVLKIIALRHGHVIPSEELIERLWPERDPKKALANLRVLVSQIRSALGDARLIAGGRSGYRFLDDEAWFDVDEFERLADAGRAALLDGRTEVATAHLEQALSLYGGDLVEADAYEEWAVGPRGRLRERHLAAREDQADALTIGGRARDAISLLERVLEGDRCREGAYRRLMLAHYLAGEQGGALRAYERCRSVLEDELGVDPLPETMALHERILRREVAAPKPARTETCAPAGLPFVGRAAERALIDAALTRRDRRPCGGDSRRGRGRQDAAGRGRDTRPTRRAGAAHSLLRA